MTGPAFSFETLIHQLEMRRNEEDQRRLLEHWLQDLPSKTLDPCLTLLLGRSPGARVTVPAIKKALFERVNPDLFDASKDTGTDLSETLALLWPGGEDPLDIAALTTALAIDLKSERAKAFITLLDTSNAHARDLAIRVATGRFRSPVSPGILRFSLAEVFGQAVSDIEQNLANTGTDITPFLNWLLGEPFPDTLTRRNGFVSLPTIQTFDEKQTDEPDLYIALPSGDYAQLVTNPDGCRLHTLAGDQLEEPGDHEELPPDTTLLVFLPKKPNSAPLLLDILMNEGDDLRNASRTQRLKVLEQLAGQGRLSGFILTDARPLPDAASCQTIFEDPSIDRLYLLQAGGSLHPSTGSLGEILRPPHDLYLKILYAEGTLSRQGTFDGVVTLGAPAPASQGANTADLVPVGKASLDLLCREDQVRLDVFIAENTLERFGPVRKLTATEETSLVARVTCRTIDQASRRKAGLVLIEAALVGLFDNSSAPRVSTLDELTSLALL